jgi:GT2 family glycosyltransferase
MAPADPPSPRATLLIPAHNRRALTLGCLRALHANGDLAACDALVIDDGSSDGTGEAIRAEFPAVRVRRGDGTLFWTGAIALGMRALLAPPVNGAMIWLNDDCRPRPGALAVLGAWLAQNPNALAAPRCIDRTGFVAATGFIGRRVFSVAPGEERRVEGVSGFCVGIGARAARALGPPDAVSFPHYAGDTAYTLRASRHGHAVVLLGDAAVDLLDDLRAPAAIATRVRGDETLATNARRIFGATASPFRLRTLFALQKLKYGPLAGGVLATTRAASWLAQLVWAKATGRRTVD